MIKVIAILAAVLILAAFIIKNKGGGCGCGGAGPKKKLNKLAGFLRAYRKVLVAFSGGGFQFPA